MAATLPASPTEPQGPPWTEHSDPAGPAPRRAVAPWADGVSRWPHGRRLAHAGIAGRHHRSLVIGAAPAIQEYGLGFLWRTSGTRSRTSSAAW
jgi:phosphate transport system permease protein